MCGANSANSTKKSAKSHKWSTFSDFSILVSWCYISWNRAGFGSSVVILMFRYDGAMLKSRSHLTHLPKIIQEKNALENVVCQIGGHFVQEEMTYYKYAWLGFHITKVRYHVMAFYSIGYICCKFPAHFGHIPRHIWLSNVCTATDIRNDIQNSTFMTMKSQMFPFDGHIQAFAILN